MEALEEIVRINSLYDYYKTLLTEKQREYFEAFYFMNESLSEIASNYSVSRNAVYSQITLTTKALEEYENSLHLFEKDEKRKKIIDKIIDECSEDIKSELLKLEEI